MNDDKDVSTAFKEKIKHMSVEELSLYVTTSNNAIACINFIGIGICFLILMTASWLIGIPCALLLTVLAHFSVGLNLTRDLIKEQIEKETNR